MGDIVAHCAQRGLRVGAVGQLQWKADIEAKTQEGLTTLQYAVTNDHAGLVKVLLDKQLHINARDTFGETPLFVASKHGLIEIKRAQRRQMSMA